MSAVLAEQLCSLSAAAVQASQAQGARGGLVEQEQPPAPRAPVLLLQAHPQGVPAPAGTVSSPVHLGALRSQLLGLGEAKNRAMHPHPSLDAAIPRIWVLFTVISRGWATPRIQLCTPHPSLHAAIPRIWVLLTVKYRGWATPRIQLCTPHPSLDVAIPRPGREGGRHGLQQALNCMTSFTPLAKPSALQLFMVRQGHGFCHKSPTAQAWIWGPDPSSVLAMRFRAHAHSKGANEQPCHIHCPDTMCASSPMPAEQRMASHALCFVAHMAPGQRR